MEYLYVFFCLLPQTSTIASLWLARGPDTYLSKTRTLLIGPSTVSRAPKQSGSKGSYHILKTTRTERNGVGETVNKVTFNRFMVASFRHLKKCILEPVLHSLQWTFHTFCCTVFFPPVVAVVLLFSHPHPSPLLSLYLLTLGPHVLPDPAQGKVCLCPRLLAYFCLSRPFPVSSYFCLLSAFISLTSGWGGSAARTIQIDHLERRRGEGRGGGGGSVGWRKRKRQDQK